jgi:hypothetical protein
MVDGHDRCRRPGFVSSLLGSLVLLGLFMAVEPIPVIGFSLTLSTPRGKANGLAFIVGWVATMAVIAACIVVLNGGDGFGAGSSVPDLSYALQLVAGLVLLTVWRLRQRLPAPEGPPPPAGWTRRIDRLSPPGAVFLGFLLQPWPLTAAGMSAILRANVGLTNSILAALLFISVSASGLAVMLAFELLAPDRAGARLGAMRLWLEMHRSAAITVVCGVAGAWLAVKGLLGLLR